MNDLLYNQERPVLFSSVEGNEETTEPLRLMVKNGNCKNAHFIFSGTPGTGKTTTGRILSRAINCTNNQEGEPCNRCENCTSHLAGKYPDYIEIDATSYNKVEDAKRLVELASQYPINPKGQRIILLDEAHVLSNAAFDKFLKLLESADVKTTFIFCTTDLHLFRPAIISRCFTFEIKPLSGSQIAKELTRICRHNNIAYEPVAINKLAYQFSGKPRDAVKTLDLYLKSYGHIKEYKKKTQEAMLLEIFKLAYFNKVTDYLPLVEQLDSSNIFRSLCRMMNEVFLYPLVVTDLIEHKDIEEFKTLVDNTHFKSIVRDAMHFKPDDTYSLTLFLATVAEIGLKLSTKEVKRKESTGRRFHNQQKPTPVKASSIVEDSEVGIDIDEPLLPEKEKLSSDDLKGFGFNKVG